MPRWFLAGALLLSAVGGCVHNPHCHGGRMVLEHRPGCKPETTTAPYQATYALYYWRTSPKDQPPPQRWIAEQEVTELYVRSLEGGQAIGFAKGEKDELFAVAGEEKLLLEPGRYCWHMTPATEYHGVRAAAHELGEALQTAVSTVVGVPVGIVATVLLLPVVLLFLPLFLLF